MTLLDLATYLQTYTPTLNLTKATNLFYGTEPPSPDLCVTLYEYASAMPEGQVGGDTLIIENPTVQVRVRGVRDDYDTPYNLARSIVNAFVKIQDGDLSGKKYQAVIPKQSVLHLGKDENFRHIFIVNFQIMKDW